MKAILSAVLTAGLLAASSASASVLAPPVPHASASVIQVRDGCGRGYHQNRWGRCVPDRAYWGDGCDRWHHRDRWGHCRRNW